MISKTMALVLLGFDFGLKRIGVAVGQGVTKTASPLQTLAAKSGVPDWHEIKKLISKWRPDALIVGIPLNMDGTEQKMSQHARAFADQLRKRCEIPVHEIDERLTSKEARARLFTQGGFKALQDGQVDAMAAQLILQNWFAEHQSE